MGVHMRRQETTGAQEHNYKGKERSIVGMSGHFSARAIESMPRESNGWATRSWYLSGDADRRRGRHAGSMIPKPSIPVISPAESSFRSGPARMGQENCDRDERMAAQ